jgi:predicted RNase H-like HicB family nuclease
MRYPVVLHTDDGVRFGVTVPDLPGCFSAGDDFDQALESAKEAIELHLEGLVEEGGDVPIPLAITAHRSNPDFADGIWAAVDIDIAKYDGRSEKINITLPRRLLAKIDDYVRSHGATRSGFLADAARVAMKR